ncbi:MAG TPA: hypothetical protein VLX29_02600 [Nitrospirota bacterium]|nr:hypothetical protein [Nitrospirota bacterium]
MLEQNSAGKNKLSYCTKCKLNLDHTIMAMNGEEIAKVRCNTCGSSHKFRDASVPQKIRKPRGKKTLSAEATTKILWEHGLADAKGKERDYHMTAKYRVGDIVNHDVFGKGIVLKIYANKCDMLFQDKERLMASANEYKRVSS